jgi:hypothetical protein
MSDTRDVRSVIDEAEKAAGAGDYLTAERLLRDVATQQEESLGPLHPDLANTLNNLAVVYETIDQPADAERCYRRAYSIAIASLEPHHPFIATSEQNYRDFCVARGIPFETRTPLPDLAPASAPVDVPSLPAIEHAVDATVPPPIAETKVAPPITESTVPASVANSYVAPPIADSDVSSSRAPAIAGVIGLVAVVIAAGLWFRANGNDETSPQTPQASQAAPSPPPSERPAPVAEPAPVPPVAAPVAPEVTKNSERPIESARPARRASTPIAEKPTLARKPATEGNPTVDEASLCSELSRRDWRCSPAGRPVDSGQLFFYTRIKSPSNLTVEHRWYRNERLERNVALRIQENQRSGFRTFSRTVVKPGDWRVELRTRDGAVLHKEAFVVTQ